MKKQHTVIFCSYLVFHLVIFWMKHLKSVINSATFYKTEGDAVAATNAIYEYLTVGTEGIFERGFGWNFL
jgi:hypothetical protein